MTSPPTRGSRSGSGSEATTDGILHHVLLHRRHRPGGPPRPPNDRSEYATRRPAPGATALSGLDWPSLDHADRLGERRATSAWPYGPPAIAASHGGSATVTGGRVARGGGPALPRGSTRAGDPERYQLVYAVNMCNGGDSCGEIPGCTPALPCGWSAYYLDDTTADYRLPVAGGGRRELGRGRERVPQNGVAQLARDLHRLLLPGTAIHRRSRLRADADDRRQRRAVRGIRFRARGTC